MSLFVCKKDPVTQALRGLMPAFHLIRVPESSIQPLIVLMKDPQQADNTLRRIGPLTDLLADAPDLPVQDSQMADLSGKKTTAVKLDLGLQLVSGFLKGFGVTAPSLTAAFDKVSTVTFSFDDVHRRFIDQTKLGNLVLNRPVALNNPAITVAQEGGRCFLIDSVVVSNNFSVHAEKTSDDNFAFNPGDITNLLAAQEQTLAVNVTDDKTVRFSGDNPLAFAFTCVELFFDETGRVTKFLSVEPEKQAVEFGFGEAPEVSILRTVSDTHLEMLDIEFTPRPVPVLR